MKKKLRFILHISTFKLYRKNLGFFHNLTSNDVPKVVDPFFSFATHFGSIDQFIGKTFGNGFN